VIDDLNAAHERELRDNLARRQAQYDDLCQQAAVLIQTAFRQPEVAEEKINQNLDRNFDKTCFRLATETYEHTWLRGYGPRQGSSLSLSGVERQKRKDAMQALKILPAVLAERKQAKQNLDAARAAWQALPRQKVGRNRLETPTEAEERAQEQKQSQRREPELVRRPERQLKLGRRR